jgi:hypothetical protein
MSTSTRSSRKAVKPTEAKYQFIKNGRIVGTAETTIEAIKLAKRFPDATVFSPSHSYNEKQLRDHRISKAKAESFGKNHG